MSKLKAKENSVDMYFLIIAWKILYLRYITEIEKTIFVFKIIMKEQLYFENAHVLELYHLWQEYASSIVDVIVCPCGLLCKDQKEKTNY